MTTESPQFRIVLRGYARAQVDEVVVHVEQVLASADHVARAKLRVRLPEARFDVVLRGYDRAEVDAYLKQVGARLARR